jgi:glycine/serine hydroxymethyltransferase
MMEVRRIVVWIHRVAEGIENAALHTAVKSEVKELCSRFPICAEFA